MRTGPAAPSSGSGKTGRRAVPSSPRSHPAGATAPLAPRPRATRGRVLLLLGLLGLWAGLAVTRWVGREAAPPRATAPASGAAARGPTDSRNALPRLKRELIDLPRPPYTAETTNPFGTPPPPPPRPVEVVRPPAPPPPAPPPPDPFAEGARSLRYVAFLQAGDAPTAMIAQGTELFSVAAGEILLGRFRVQSIADDVVVLTSPEGDKQVRLALQSGTAPAAQPPGR